MPPDEEDRTSEQSTKGPLERRYSMHYSYISITLPKVYTYRIIISFFRTTDFYSRHILSGNKEPLFYLGAREDPVLGSERGVTSLCNLDDIAIAGHEGQWLLVFSLACSFQFSQEASHRNLICK